MSRRWTARTCALQLLLGAGLALVAEPDAHAIIIRHDTADSNYVVADEEFPALVDLLEPGDCIGTLVHASYLLTVAHCAVDLNAGASFSFNGIPYSVAEVILHPDWTDGDDYDIALVRFAVPVRDVTPLPIYRGSAELGALMTLVGRGDTATGLEGEAGAPNDGKLRRATNVASAVNEFVIEFFFEEPAQSGVTALEGVGAGGDSGGPVFIEVDGVSYIAGLNSYGETNGSATFGEYGALDYQTRVSGYLDWLDGIVDWPAAEPEPEPEPDPVVEPTPEPTPAPVEGQADAPHPPSGCSLTRRRSGQRWMAMWVLALLALGCRRNRECLSR